MRTRMNAAHARLARTTLRISPTSGALVPYFSLWLAAQGYDARADRVGPRDAAGRARVRAGALGLARGSHRLAARNRDLRRFRGPRASRRCTWLRGAADVAPVMLLAERAGGRRDAAGGGRHARGDAGRPGSYGPIRLWGSIGFILAVLGTGAWLDRHGAADVLDIVVGLAALVCVAAFGVPARASRTAAAPGARACGRRACGARRCSRFFGACMCMCRGARRALRLLFDLPGRRGLFEGGHRRSLDARLVLPKSPCSLRLPQLMRRFSLRALLIASFACAALRFPAIGWGVELLALLAAAQLLHAATFGAFHAASIATVHRMFPGRLAGRGQALYSASPTALAAPPAP